MARKGTYKLAKELLTAKEYQAWLRMSPKLSASELRAGKRPGGKKAKAAPKTKAAPKKGKRAAPKKAAPKGATKRKGKKAGAPTIRHRVAHLKQYFRAYPELFTVGEDVEAIALVESGYYDVPQALYKATGLKAAPGEPHYIKYKAKKGTELSDYQAKSSWRAAYEVLKAELPDDQAAKLATEVVRSAEYITRLQEGVSKRKAAQEAAKDFIYGYEENPSHRRRRRRYRKNPAPRCSTSGRWAVVTSEGGKQYCTFATKNKSLASRAAKAMRAKGRNSRVVDRGLRANPSRKRKRRRTKSRARR